MGLQHSHNHIVATYMFSQPQNPVYKGTKTEQIDWYLAGKLFGPYQIFTPRFYLTKWIESVPKNPSATSCLSHLPCPKYPTSVGLTGLEFAAMALMDDSVDFAIFRSRTPHSSK